MSHRVIAIDRPGQILATADAPVGYAFFADDVAGVFAHFKLKHIKVVAFASANLTLNLLFAKHPEVGIASVVMIDQDVLTPFSIGRFSGDAAPFKENRKKYRDYIGAGNYAEHAQQKNQVERKHRQVLAGEDENTDWAYVDKIFKARLAIPNLQNLFAELAIYADDLRLVAAAGLPH